MTRNLSVLNNQYECDIDKNDSTMIGGRGVTIWGPISDFQISPGSSHTLTFNGTHPAGYLVQDASNVYFTYKTTSSKANSADIGPLVVDLNGHNNVGLFYRSATVNHDVTNCWELANSGYLNDSGYNTWTFRNLDSNATALITGFKIVRNYGMVNMLNQPCDDDFVEPASNGTIDSWREDYACNWQNCGGLSYTTFNNSGYNNDQRITVPAGQSFSWSFTCPIGDPATYVGPKSCLFNFNQATMGSPYTQDANYTISLNGSAIATFYQSSVPNHNAFPSIDLCNYPSHYNDTGTNTVTVTVNQGEGLALSLIEQWGVNVYRIYQTKKLGHTITASSDAHSSISPSGSTYVLQTRDQQYSMSAASGYAINDVITDSINHHGSITSYTFPDVVNDHTISVTSSCQTGCQTSCQTCYGCQTCIACYSCYIGCMEGCEVSCETGCEVNCETGCEVSCQSCNTCQTTCELACQTGCQVSCQTGCEVSCQECNTCQTCQLGCQDACQVSCQDCQSCNTCQDACQSLCQSCYICQPVCNWCQNCMIGY
jgi:hypothetical protein